MCKYFKICIAGCEHLLPDGTCSDTAKKVHPFQTSRHVYPRVREVMSSDSICDVLGYRTVSQQINAFVSAGISLVEARRAADAGATYGSDYHQPLEDPLQRIDDPTELEGLEETYLSRAREAMQPKKRATIEDIVDAVNKQKEMLSTDSK